MLFRLGGSGGSRGGRFVSARGLAVAADGTVYLAESGRGIWVFTADGTLRTTFGKGEILDAYDVALGAEGAIFVADYGRNAIAVFRPDGSFVRRWGSAGDGPEQFSLASPQRIAVGPDGSLYALDVRSTASGAVVSSILRFKSADGSFIERIPLPANTAPNDIAIDATGHIYLAETFSTAVLRLDAHGEVLGTLGASVTPEGIIAGVLDLDAQGNLYVATWNTGIIKLAPGGALLAQAGTVATSGNTPKLGQFSLPNGIAVAPNGTVWVSDNSGEYSAVTVVRPVSNAEAEATAAALATTLATPPAEAQLLRQWAKSASASSSYADYDPQTATGPPDVAGCEDSTNAWASADPNGLETLELRYASPVFATEVVIYQNHRPGYISRVELLDSQGQATAVYTATPALDSTCPRVLRIAIPQSFYPTTAIRITLDQRSGANWNEIDAVELVGMP